MKKVMIYFALVIILVVLIFVVYQVKTISGSKSVQSDINISATTVSVYVDNCVRCHGRGGEGFGDKPAINNTSLNIEEIKNVILKGLEKMPAFQNINDPVLTEMAEYVKNF